MELIDGYNENNEPTGDVVERFDAFDKGLWRRTVSCWILNEKGEVLIFQSSREITQDEDREALSHWGVRRKYFSLCTWTST